MSLRAKFFTNNCFHNCESRYKLAIMKLINFKLILSILLLSSISAFAVIDVVHLGSFGKSGAWQAKEFKDGQQRFVISYQSR